MPSILVWIARVELDGPLSPRLRFVYVICTSVEKKTRFFEMLVLGAQLADLDEQTHF